MKRRPQPRVLVVYKKSAYQVYVRERKNERIATLIKDGNPAVSRLLQAHEDHVASMEEARAALKKLDAHAEFRYRGDEHLSEKFDLVVTLGGDGTLLWASHFVGGSTPVVSINTAPNNSVGFFAAGTRHQIGDVLQDALDGALRATMLSRMQVLRDKDVLSSRVLNDALFTHECPAATTRYTLTHDGKEEEQKSSGIWIGPAAGSTAAIRSAGGRKMKVSSKELQFVVREPYQAPGVRYELKRGFVADGQALEVINRTRSGRLYVDGSHMAHPVDIGSTLRFSRSGESLTLLGFSRRS